MKPGPAAEPLAAVASVADCLALPGLRQSRVCGGSAGLGSRVRWATNAADVRGCAAGEFRLVARLDDPTAVARAAGAGAAALGTLSVDPAVAACADAHRLPVVQLPSSPRLDVVASELLDYVIAALDSTVTAMQRVASRLAAAACDDLRVDSVAEALAAATGTPVLVEDASFRMLCAVGDGQVDANRAETIRAGGTPPRYRATVRMRRFYESVAASGRAARLDPAPEIGLTQPRLVAPIRAAGELMGYVTVIVPAGEQGRRLCAMALEHATHLIALAVVHRRATELGGRLASSRLLVDLLDGHGPPELVAARAAHAGVDLAGEHSVAVVALAAGASPDATVARAAGVLPPSPPPLLDVLGGLLVVHLGAGDREARLASAERVRLAVGSPLALLSRTVAQGGLPEAHAETRRALDMASRAGRAGTLDAGELGLVGLLLAATGDGTLQRFAASRLQPLVDYDRREGTDLCGSLEAYLDAGSIRPAARRLGIHANTLAYRLRRAATLGGIDLESADHRMELTLALRCRRLLLTP